MIPVQIAAPLPTTAYDYYRTKAIFVAKCPTGLLRLAPGDVYGVRPSTDGKKIRLIRPGIPGKVYTITANDAQRLANESSVFRGKVEHAARETADTAHEMAALRYVRELLNLTSTGTLETVLGEIPGAKVHVRIWISPKFQYVMAAAALHKRAQEGLGRSRRFERVKTVKMSGVMVEVLERGREVRVDSNKFIQVVWRTDRRSAAEFAFVDVVQM